MAWRFAELAAALVIVGGVLGVSTALIGEVHDAVLEAEPPQPELDISPPDAPDQGLPLTAFTLLDPAPATLPQAPLDDDPIALPQPGQLHLSQGDRIEPDPLPLPTHADALFPNGATAHEQGLECTRGCQIDVGQRVLEAPPGAVLEITDPPKPAPAPGDSHSLASGARLIIAPIPVTSDTTLPLQTGTTVTPPDHLDPEPLSPEDRIRLPPGTRIDGPPGGALDASTLNDLQQAPDPPTLDPPTHSLTAPNVTLTETPDALRKGAPFQASGLATLPDGTPLPHLPVRISINDTDPAEGYALHEDPVRTGPDGSFDATLRIPEDAPAKPYHLTARTLPQPDHDPALGPGSDETHLPLIAGTQLHLDAPDTEGLKLPLLLQATLTDTHDAPVPDQSILLEVPGTDFSTFARTDHDGRALVIADDGLPSRGDWTLEATFLGTDHLERSTTTTPIEAIHERIETPARIQTERGDTATVEGRVLHDGAPRTLAITAQLFNETHDATTDEDGRFTLPLPIPADAPLGNHTLTLHTDATRAQRTLLVTVQAPTVLHAQAPSPLPRNGTLPLTLEATTPDDEPAPRLPLHARSPHMEPQTATTDKTGHATLAIPLDATEIPLTLHTPGTDTHGPNTTNLTLDTHPLDTDGALTAVQGTPHNTTLTLTAGAPLPHEPVRLDGPGLNANTRTDANGTATFHLKAPPGIAPGGHQATLHLPRYDASTTVPLTILKAPSLDVTILEPGTDGAPIRLKASVHDDEAPLGQVPVRAEATGAFQGTATALTDPTGHATLTLDRPSNAQGDATITIRAERTADTATTTAETTVPVTPSPFPWWTLLGGLPLAGAAWALHRRRASTPTKPADPDAGPQLRMQLDPQEDAWPPVWHPEEPVTLEIGLRDENGTPLPDRTLTLQGPKGTKTVTTSAHGTSRIRLPPHRQGTYSYTVRHDGHKPVETLLELRVVDYEEEIDREYVDLHQQAVQAGLADASMTPGELARSLPAEDPARTVARIFQRSNYSPRGVTRDDYERFMKAKEACRVDGTPAF